MDIKENAGSSRDFKVNYGLPQSEDRNKIIHISTQIESEIADLLSLAIGDIEGKSISFGYSASALSLAARINLLIDFGIFTKNEKRYFLKFTEMRNKFAHNHYVYNLHQFLINEPKKDILNFLENQFKKEIDNYEVCEEHSWKLFHLLIEKIEQALTKLSQHLIGNSRKIGEISFRNSFYEEFRKLTDDDDFIDSLSGSPTEIILILYKELQHRLDKGKKTHEDIIEGMRGKILL